MKSVRLRPSAALLLTLALLLTACGGAATAPSTAKPAASAPAASAPAAPAKAAPEEWPKIMSVGVLSARGTSFEIGTAIAQAIERYTPAKSAVQVADGPFRSMEGMQDGTYHVTQNNAQYVQDAYYADRKASPSFGKPVMDFSQIFYNYAGYMIMAARPDRGINTIQDVVGKTGIVERPESPDSTDKMSGPLKHLGLLDKVNKRAYTGDKDLAEAYKQGRIDFFIHTSGSYVQELAATVGVKLIDIPAAAVEATAKETKLIMNSRYIPPDVLKGMGLDEKLKVLSFDYINATFVNPKMPDHQAYGIVKAFHDNHKALAGISPMVAQATIDHAFDYMGVPYHPGAIKYYKEKGVWKADQEKRNQELIARVRVGKK